MKPNRIREAWIRGECAATSFLALACPFSAEIMAAQGYQALTVDLQHGVVDYMTMVGMFQAMEVYGCTPMARLMSKDPAHVMQVLDAGARGVICPMVNTADDARSLVSALHYPPEGSRSFGPVRASLGAGTDYRETYAEGLICFAMIETEDGLANVEKIAAVPGLTGLYIGPVDLSLAITGRKYRSGFDRSEPEILEQIHRIRTAAHEAGIRAALHCGTAEYARKARDWGFDMVTLNSDMRLLGGAAAAILRDFRA
jgi:4-hydroxy-2-oxoheptanedioate aldolase